VSLDLYHTFSTLAVTTLCYEFPMQVNPLWDPHALKVIINFHIGDYEGSLKYYYLTIVNGMPWTLCSSEGSDPEALSYLSDICHDIEVFVPNLSDIDSYYLKKFNIFAKNMPMHKTDFKHTGFSELFQTIFFKHPLSFEPQPTTKDEPIVNYKIKHFKSKGLKEGGQDFSLSSDYLKPIKNSYKDELPSQQEMHQKMKRKIACYGFSTVEKLFPNLVDKHATIQIFVKICGITKIVKTRPDASCEEILDSMRMPLQHAFFLHDDGKVLKDNQTVQICYRLYGGMEKLKNNKALVEDKPKNTHALMFYETNLWLNDKLIPINKSPKSIVELHMNRPGTHFYTVPGLKKDVSSFMWRDENYKKSDEINHWFVNTNTYVNDEKNKHFAIFIDGTESYLFMTYGLFWHFHSHQCSETVITDYFHRHTGKSIDHDQHVGDCPNCYKTPKMLIDNLGKELQLVRIL